MRLAHAVLLGLLGCVVIAPGASAWLITERGPEPMFVEVKQSLRLAPDLDAQLQALADAEANLGLTVVRRFVGSKYLELLSFPANFTEEQALAASLVVRGLPMVAQIVVYSAFNLVFRSGDFSHPFEPNELIPEAVRRGLESGPTPRFDPLVVLQPHTRNQLIVAWKPEFVWNAEQTGFLRQIAAFNAAAGCRVLSESRDSNIDLTQVLQFFGPDSLLANKLQHYLASGWVKFAQPSFSYTINGGGAPAPRRVERARVRRGERGRGQRQAE